MPSRRRALLGGTSLCLGSLAGCLDRRYADQEPNPAEWPVSRQNVRNTGSVPDASLSADPIWTREDLELTDEVGSIALAGETLVVAGFARASEKPVYALALSTGETQWTQTVQGHPTSMAVAGDRLYLGTSLGNLVAFG